MTATPILAQGTTVSVDDNVSSPVTINGVMGIGGIGSGSATEIDVTTLASTAKEFRQGLQDFGSVTLELIRDLDDAGQAELLAIQASQSTRTFIITLPTSTLNVATFEGFVTSISSEVGADDVVKGTCNVRITGAIVWS